MKANEIKINNYLNHTDFGIIKVEGIKPHCGDFEISVKDTWLYLKKCKPIQLTEELLLKCGFEEKHLVQWNGNGADYQPKDVYTQQKDFTTNNFIVRHETFTANGEQSTEMFCGLIGDWYEKITFDSLPIYQLKYLHQLQNIFFALTNQELKINL